MSTSAVGTWLSFFKDAGIPSGLGATYAVIFCDHRIQKEYLGDLSREFLIEMGIKAMGDVIAILKHAKHVATEISRESTSKLLKYNDSSTVKSKSVSTSPSRAEASSYVETMETNEAEKTVFTRLGNENTASNGIAVFRRLGDPVAASDSESKSSRKGKSDAAKNSSPNPPASAIVTPKKKVAVKRKHVLDRLGPESDPKVVTGSMKADHPDERRRRSVLKRLGCTPEPESPGSDGTGRSSSDEEEKETKIRNVGAKQQRRAESSSGRQKHSSILSRLGEQRRPAMNTEPKRRKSPIIKRTFGPLKRTTIGVARKYSVLAMDQEAKMNIVAPKVVLLRQSNVKSSVGNKVLAMDAEVRASPRTRLLLKRGITSKKNARDSTGAFARKAFAEGMLSVVRVKQRKNPALKISHSSDKSAGIFAVAKARKTSSVFDRLGS